MWSYTLWFLKNYRAVWWFIFLSSALPSVIMGRQFYTQQLGPNPLQYLQHATGRWALIFLLLSLTITPLRQILSAFCIYLHVRFGKRLEDWNWIIRLRRMLGLYCFYYASLHMLVYVLFDLALQWRWAVSDIQEKPYIILGVTAFVMLVPLAITSHSKLFQLMGVRAWKRLHKIVYLILLIVIMHFWWQTKTGVYDYLPYAIVACLLLGFRLLNWWGVFRRCSGSDGMAVTPRV